MYPRIPSDKGYRFYVDLLMEKKEQEISEREDALLEKTDKVEKVLQQVWQYGLNYLINH